MPEHKAKNNRTLILEESEIPSLRERLLTKNNITPETSVLNRTLNGDMIQML